MTVQLESLRVFAEMDATRYVAGMNQKIAADKAGAASSTQVGTAVQSTDAKLSVAGNSATRLARQYVDGFAGAQRFSAAIGSLGRAIETGNVTMTQADVILEGIYRKYNLMANAAELAEAGNLSLAASVTALNTRLAAQEAAADGTANAMRRLGAANDNAAWQTRNLQFQMYDVVQRRALGQNPMMTLLQQGPQIAQIYGPEEGGVARALKETGRMAGNAATGMLRLAAANPLVTAGLAVAAGSLYNIKEELQAAGHESVGFADVFVASMQVIGSGLYSFFEPAIIKVQSWIGTAWDWISEKTHWLGNKIINAFRAAAADIGFLWNQLPNIVGAAAIGSANAVLGGVESMLNGVSDRINTFVSWVEGILNKLPDWAKPEGGFDLGEVYRADFGRIDNPYATDFSAANEAHKKRVRGILTSDPIGTFTDMVKDQVLANESGKAEEAVNKVSKAVRNAADGWKSYGQEAARAIEDTINFAQDLAGGFVTDLRSGLEEGKGIWGSFADAALNALDKISEKLLGMAADQLITNLLGSLFGGGFLSPKAWGAIQSGGGGLYANGGYTGAGAKYDPAGIVHRGEIVWSQSDIARAGGVGVVEAMRQGFATFAGGGVVGQTMPDPAVKVGTSGGFGEVLAA